MGRMFVLTGVHTYLADAVRQSGRLGQLRAELEEALRDIKGQENPPAGSGIVVKDTYRVAQGDAPAARNAERQPQTQNSKPRRKWQRKAVQGGSQGSTAKPAAEQNVKAPEINKGSCYNCGRKGHYAKDCRSPKKLDGNSGKAGGQ